MGEKKRKRGVRVVFYVSEQERDLIAEKMQTAGIRNREAYLRKMALDGYVIKLDLASVNKMVSLLSNATNNLNQIARRVNETGNLYREDIADLQEHYERLWEQAEGIMRKLAEV